MMLIVGHPAVLKAFPHGVPWLYADEDPVEYGRIVARLGEENRFVSAMAFQAAAIRLRQPFLCWLDMVLKSKAEYNWIIASYFKDTFSTPVFLHLVCLTLISQALRHDQEKIVVITRDPALVEQLRCVALIQRASFQSMGKRALAQERIACELRGFGRIVLHPWRIARRMFLARCALGKKYLKRLSGAEVLVDTFIFENDIDGNGEFRDRFLPGLVGWFQSNGKHVVSLPYTANIPINKLYKFFLRMKESNTLFAPGELFLRLSDLVAGVQRGLAAYASPPSFSACHFEEMDVSCLSKYWWKVSALNTLISQIWYKTPIRMVAAGIKPSLVVDWFENQPLDKAIFIGFKQASPDINVVGARLFFPYANTLSLFTTGGEQIAGVAPSINWICGHEMAKHFSIYDDIGSYCVVPALRYSYLYDDFPPVDEGKSLVLFLTSSPQESMNILECALSKPIVLAEKFKEIIIKSHQALLGDFEALVKDKWPESRQCPIIWKNQSSPVLLRQAKLMVTSGSSVALESVCHGVPVVIVGRSAGLDMNPLEDVDSRLWRLLYDPASFCSSLEEWLPFLPNFNERKKIGESVRNSYFQRTAPETMLAFNEYLR